MDKLKRAFDENKKYLILFLVLWIVLEIVLIAPMAVAIAESTTVDGKFELANFIENFGKSALSCRFNLYAFSSSIFFAFISEM